MTHTFYSYCKINLGLEVLGVRPDGYHELNTVFYRLDEPCDRFEVETSAAYRLTLTGTDVAADEKNLVTRAIKACADAAGIGMPPLHIHLTKRVPIGAGLGGGSANAATAIRIFITLVAPLSDAEQSRVARSLGADVPFFLLEGRAALGKGIGDELSEVDIALPFAVLVVKPKDVSINTAEAYRMLDRGPHRNGATDLVAALHADPDKWMYGIRNDFEPIALTMAPQLHQLRERLSASGAFFVRMSGSGSAFVALFRTNEAAESAAEALRSEVTLQVFVNQRR